MKESISNAMIFSIVITVVGICAGIVFFSLGYSKTFKIKTKLIDIIEKYEGYSDSNTTEVDEINSFLKKAGYPTKSNDGQPCPSLDGLTAINTITTYKYCIYEHKTVKGSYYTVIVYQVYELPLISDAGMTLRFKMTGDSKVLITF